MICDNCTHKEVCVYKENCNTLERSTKPYKVEIFILEVRCPHKETTPTILNSYQMP